MMIEKLLPYILELSIALNDLSVMFNLSTKSVKGEFRIVGTKWLSRKTVRINDRKWTLGTLDLHKSWREFNTGSFN